MSNLTYEDIVEKSYPSGEMELEAPQASIFRGIVARANYLGQDRTDIKYATKELSTRMAKPRERDVEIAKRLIGQAFE